MNCSILRTLVVYARQGTWSLLRNAFILLISVAFALSLLQPLYGQGTGSFSGTVTDKSGSNVAGASVTATSRATGLARTGKTDDGGHYVIPLLPVGAYTVRVDSSGFQSSETKDLTLQVDQALELNFTLSPASVTTTVEVTANSVAAETTNPSLGQVITSQQVSQLPLNGRDFVQLATLTAGATAETNPNSFFTSAASSEVAARGPFSLSVGGSRPNSADWLLDNVDNNELTAGGIAILTSIDDIQEFKVLTYTYSAEYGTRAGPTVLITTKSGSNAFHGSLFEFLRNTSLDAKSYFADKAEKFNLNQFGGTIGGPIQKNKTFFFVDGEQKYQRHGIVFTGLVPSVAMRSGDFSNDAFGNPLTGPNGSFNPVIVNPNMIGASTDPNVYPNIYFQCNAGKPILAKADGSQPKGTPCNQIPTNLFNNIGSAMINLYPTPNASNATAGYNYVNTPVRELDETKFDVRLDHNFNNADSVFGRFSYDQAFSYVPGGSPGFAAANAFGTNQRIINHARNAALGWTHVFSANMVNQFNFGYNRIFDYISSFGTGTCASANIPSNTGNTGIQIPNANLGCSGAPPKCAAGAYSCGLVSTEFFENYWAVGDRGYSPFQGGTNIYSYRDSLDITHGKHSIHAGLDFRANQMNVGTEAFQDGFWIIGAFGNFTGYSGDPNNPSVNILGNPQADFLLGIPGLAIHDQTYQGPVTGRRWKIIRPFIEDDWRVANSLTLNLGIAYAMTTPVTEAHGRLANYVPTTGQLLIANQNGVGPAAGVARDWTGLEPRVGGAWKIRSNGNTVLRAGFALFHDSAWSMGAQGLWQNPPFLGESDAFPATFSAGCAFSTSYCATVLGQTPEDISLSQGFQAIPTPPTAANFTGSFYTQPTNFKMGRVKQYNANVEQVIPGNVVLTAGYAGARGTHILVQGNDLNTDSPSACDPTSPDYKPGYSLGCVSSGVPYFYPYQPPNFNAILLFGDVGVTNYDSLQIKAETKTAKHGLYALVAYTYSKTYDNGLTDGLGSQLSAPYFPLPNWQSLDWSLSQINLDNSFIASVIYDLPFGRGRQFGTDWNAVTNTILGNWRVTLIQRISSGFPDPLIDSNNQSGVAFNTGGNDNNWNRPNQVSGCNVHAANHAALQYINPTCFIAPPSGQLGNASRVPVVGPDFVNSDFSVIKQFELPREGMGLDFRAEFFNLWNHAQFGLPVNDINAEGFGAVNSTVNNPRLVQFALKLTF